MVTIEDIARIHEDLLYREVCMDHLKAMERYCEADVRLARDWSQDHPDDVVRIAARLWLEKNVLFFANKYLGDE